MPRTLRCQKRKSFGGPTARRLWVTLGYSSGCQWCQPPQRNPYNIIEDIEVLQNTYPILVLYRPLSKAQIEMQALTYRTRSSFSLAGAIGSHWFGADACMQFELWAGWPSALTYCNIDSLVGFKHASRRLIYSYRRTMISTPPSVALRRWDEQPCTSSKRTNVRRGQ